MGRRRWSRRNAAVFAAVLALGAASAPGQGWLRAVEGGATLTDVDGTAGGDLYLVGQDVGGPLVMRLDSAGDVLWAERLDDAGLGPAAGVRATPDGGCVVAATVGGAAWLAKLDAAGAIEWQVTPSGGPASPPSGLAATADGGALLVGVDPPWLWLVDGSGATVHHDALSAPGGVSSVVVTREALGSVLAACTGASHATCVVTRLDASGAIAAEAAFDVNQGQRVVTIVPLQDGGLAIGVVRDADPTFASSCFHRLDPLLRSEWMTCAFDSARDIRIGGVRSLPGGSLLVASVVSPHVAGMPVGRGAATITALDDLGGLAWSREYGPDLADWTTLAPTADRGGFLLDDSKLRRVDDGGAAGSSCSGEMVDSTLRWNTSRGNLARPDRLARAPLGSISNATYAVATPAGAVLGRQVDRHEPDDSCASPGALREIETQANDFCDDAEDWYEVFTCVGTTYEVAAGPVGASADLGVEVFASDCSRLLAAYDEGGTARVIWTSDEDGRALLRVRQVDGSSGPGREYDVDLRVIGPPCASWARTLRSAPRDADVLAFVARPRADGSIVATGSLSGETSDTGVVSLLDAGGAVTRSVGHASTGWITGDVVALPSGDFLVAGASGAQVRASLRSHDANGDVRWIREYSGLGNTCPSRVRVRSDGRVTVVGAGRDPVSGAPFVLQVAPDGAVDWVRKAGDRCRGTGVDALEAADGGTLVAWTSFDQAGLVVAHFDVGGSVTSQALLQIGVSDGRVLMEGGADGSVLVAASSSVAKLRQDATVVWRRVPLGSSEELEATALGATPDGGCVVAGILRVSRTPVVFRLDSRGDVLWQRALVDPAYLGAIVTAIGDLQGGGRLLSGTRSRDAFVMTLDPDGFVAEPCVIGESALASVPTSTSVRRSYMSCSTPSPGYIDRSHAAASDVLLYEHGCAASRLEPRAERCANAVDDDLDGAVDCADSDCALDLACVERCANGLDDDLDGAIDCADPGCARDPSCAEWCGNGLDDDVDGRIDCDDPDCASHSTCLEDCANGVDDDRDGLIDCFDSDCAGGPACVEICLNGLDDDADGRVDCADSDCYRFDFDADGVSDCADCAPFDPGAHGRPEEVVDLRVTKAARDGSIVRVSWSGSAQADAGPGTGHDVASGLVAQLRGAHWYPPSDCVADGELATWIDDARPGLVPRWYLVRAQNACASGIWDRWEHPEGCP